jgi:S-adenosylmethionine:diacylglycerol 3-amino-3-carboxypropyl transferase
LLFSKTTSRSGADCSRFGPSNTAAASDCPATKPLADPAKIIAVDLNPNHIALTKLKLSALQNLPSYEEFFRFFGQANDRANRKKSTGCARRARR